VAKGLDFVGLGPFFSELDAIETQAGGLAESGEADGKRQGEQTETPSARQGGTFLGGAGLAAVVGTHARDPLSAAEEDCAILTRLAAALVNVVADAESGRQIAAPRRKSTKRRKSPRAHRRPVAGRPA
jgi:hypothetical protein